MLTTHRTIINILNGGRSATGPTRLFMPLGITIFRYCSSMTAFFFSTPRISIKSLKGEKYFLCVPKIFFYDIGWVD